MDDLNDLAYFAHVAEHGGFAAAERATGTPKSRLSRRLAALEAQLGARLIQRSTRRFAVTAVGERVLQHARAMLSEAESARALVDEEAGAPRGSLRLACPPALLQAAVSPMLPDRRYARTASTRRSRSAVPHRSSASSTSETTDLPVALSARAAKRAHPRPQVIARVSPVSKTCARSRPRCISTCRRGSKPSRRP